MAMACAAALCLAAAAPRPPIASAYFEGEEVAIRLQPASKGSRALDLGPWRLGVSARDERPRDRRLNLYVVIPGRQHHADGWDEYDCNMIINAVPSTEDAVEWDVYWVLVLDPHMRRDLRSERDLLLLAQDHFVPGDLFEFDDIPARTVLRDSLHIDSLPELEQFRQKDRSLPRILVLPAGGVAHMKVEVPAGAAAQ